MLKNFSIIMAIIYILLCIISCFDNCFSYLYYCSLDIWSTDTDTFIVNMNPGGNSSGGDAGFNPGGGSSNPEGGGPNPGGGPQWRPFEYQSNVREDNQRYPMSNISPVSVLETYDPTGNIPPQNDRELGVLMDYNFNHKVRSLGFDCWNVKNTFPSDSLVDKSAKSRLLVHIYDNRSRLPTAYKQLDLLNGGPKWEAVSITSYLINSLHNSNF